MDKQTKGERIGGTHGGVDGGESDNYNSQLGKTKEGMAINRIANAKSESRGSRSDNTPNPRVG